MTDLSFEEAGAQASEGPRRQRAEQAADAFPEASIEARVDSLDYGQDLQKVPLSRYFSNGANGIRTRDLLLAKKPVRTGKVA